MTSNFFLNICLSTLEASITVCKCLELAIKIFAGIATRENISSVKCVKETVAQKNPTSLSRGDTLQQESGL